jgi:hypothetical protein
LSTINARSRLAARYQTQALLAPPGQPSSAAPAAPAPAAAPPAPTLLRLSRSLPAPRAEDFLQLSGDGAAGGGGGGGGGATLLSPFLPGGGGRYRGWE